MVEQWEEKPKLTSIAAVIFCEREGQKRIIVGKGGAMLKKIGTESRLEIERLLGTKVHLHDRGGKGSIEIEFFSYEDLDRLLSLFRK